MTRVGARGASGVAHQAGGSGRVGGRCSPTSAARCATSLVTAGGQVSAATSTPSASQRNNALGSGRVSGSFARQDRSASLRSAGTPVRSGEPCTTRNSIAAGSPRPNGPRPVAAKTSTAAAENTSAAGPAAPPAACSGDMYAAVPTMSPARVSSVWSAARAMPKSIRRGPSAASRTLLGFTSRWTTPAWCTATIASSTPAPSRRSTLGPKGPQWVTASCREGPGTYRVASHGVAASGSASTTGAVNAPLTSLAAATSRRKRSRNPPSPASSGRTTLTAISRPEGEWARNTRPMPPSPIRARRV